MLAHEVLRAAAAIIKAGGWSQGAVARNGDGKPVPLFRGDAKAGVNPEAVSFSIYGAVCKAIHAASGRVERGPLIWDVLYRLAQAGGTPTGGANYVHPVMQYNEAEGRTLAEVLALIDLAAVECEEIGDGPYPLPVTADPRQVAAVL